MTIEQDLATVLQALGDAGHGTRVTGPELEERTEISPERINDAVSILEDNGYIQTVQTMGTSPFDFRDVHVTADGRYELERARKAANESQTTASEAEIRPSPQPVGSPYGFMDEDWEFIDRERKSKRLIVVFGHQFESEHYNSEALERNLRAQFEAALATANTELGTNFPMDFIPLRAGYGEHLFNQIARSIIAADIAVFDTSDLNPNVMIEMGVALTWGIRVHPIRHSDRPEPPSDISGQTWACFREDGGSWEDHDHAARLISMVKQAVRRKASRL